MRKYDIKNKRNIGIIIGISVVIIVMFSLIIRLFLSGDRREYTVNSDSLVFDKDKSIIKVLDSGTIKKKWSNEYFLSYNDKNYELGDTAISNNEKSGEIVLYGKYYEIGSGDLITVTDGETVIKSSLLTKFYKLADRKYLVIDKEIKTTDGLLSTSDFLMVDLDKVGNATLTNHKVSLKSFSATTIVTSNYSFDIANEILTYGSNRIDLKKIIGSSNTYTKEDLIPEDNNGGTNGDSSTGGNGSGNGGTGTGGGTNGNGSTGGDTTGTGGNTVIKEIEKATKRTSVIAVTSSINSISIDYVVYDPYKEYTSVYMEVNENGSNKIDTIYLNKNDTKYEINDIFPNTTYNLSFKYTYLEDGEVHTDTFDNITVTTKRPKVNIKTTSVEGGNIKYLVTSESNFKFSVGTLKVYVNEQLVSSSVIDDTIGNVYVNASVGDKIELLLTDVMFNNRVISGVKTSNKFIYQGGTTMKEFIKKKYNILIPAFLVIVVLIAVLLYVKEYRNNRYAILTDTDVYQYFSGNKMEYVARIGRNRKKVVLNFEAKDFAVSLDSTPVYVKDDKNTSVIFPKEMAVFFPLEDKIYQVNALSEVYVKNDLAYLRLNRLDKTFDHMFLYDGKDLYFFIDNVTIVTLDREINLSPMSYVNCSYLNMIEYYDKESDTYGSIDYDKGSVYVKNDYMNIDVSLDRVVYKDDFYLLGGDFGNYKKITDIDKK